MFDSLFLKDCGNLLWYCAIPNHSLSKKCCSCTLWSLNIIVIIINSLPMVYCTSQKSLSNNEYKSLPLINLSIVLILYGQLLGNLSN